jgi:hypothetical protein
MPRIHLRNAVKKYEKPRGTSKLLSLLLLALGEIVTLMDEKEPPTIGRRRMYLSSYYLPMIRRPERDSTEEEQAVPWDDAAEVRAFLNGHADVVHFNVRVGYYHATVLVVLSLSPSSPSVDDIGAHYPRDGVKLKETKGYWSNGLHFDGAPGLTRTLDQVSFPPKPYFLFEEPRLSDRRTTRTPVAELWS